MSNARIYIVTSGNTEKLVKATNQAQALRHVARTTYAVRAATVIEVAEKMGVGAKVEDATAEPTGDGAA